MFRPEALWIAALIATGLVGGAIYNWPSAEDESLPTEVIDASENQDVAQGFSLTQSADRQANNEISDVTTLATNAEDGFVPEQPLVMEAESTANSTVDHSIAQSLVPESEGITEPIPLDALRIGDRLLTGGNFIGAYRHFKKLARQSEGRSDGALAVRMALASELAGFADQAESHYREAIDSPSSRLLQQLWGLLGTARVWESQQRYDEAISLLSELFLLYGNERYPLEIRLPIHKHLTDCLQKRYLKEVAEDPEAVAERILYHFTDVNLDSIIDDRLEVPNEASPLAEGLNLQVLQQPVSDVSLIVVGAKTSFYPTLRMLTELGQQIGVDFRVSNRARDLLRGRSIRVDFSALPVSVLLDQTLGGLPLAWRQSDGVVDISHRDELKEAEHQQLSIERIQRMLRQRQVNFSSGSETAAVMMQDANNCIVLGDVENAANKYKSARDARPTGELSAKLYFNVGMLEASFGRKESALKEFYQALDQTLSPAIQSSSYARIADLELTLGRPSQAIPAASRGRRLATDSHVAAENLMLLAKSYLLESDPYSANQVLFDYSPSIEDPARRRLAGVLATYARYRVVGAVAGLQNEGERLVLSLVSLKPEDASSFVDHLIVSRALRDVGFRSKAIEYLKRAMENAAEGYWSRRIQFELANILYEANQPDEASALLETMEQAPQRELVAEASLLNARIQFDQESYSRSQAICERLLRQELKEEQKKAALEILGKCYQQTGEHYAAALCFAGLLPKTPEVEN